MSPIRLGLKGDVLQGAPALFELGRMPMPPPM